MGNYKFKLSEFIPNAWFYKLRDMGKKKSKSKKHQQQNSEVSPSPVKKHQAVLTQTTTAARSPRPLPPHPPRRSSQYNSRPGKTAPSSSPPPSDTPRKSSGNRRRHHRPLTTVKTRSSASKPQLVDFSTTSGDSTATGTGSFSPEFRSDQVLLPDESLTSSWQSPCSYVSSKLSKPELDLRPIVTKTVTKPTVRKTTANSPATGMRLKLRSPRISTRKSVSKRNESSSSSTAKTTVASSRRSRAVVKASVNPRKDFKESMEEMIVENNIRGSKDLEELLACYLCLNSDEYHEVIINVFKQIWIDLNLPIHISNK